MMFHPPPFSKQRRKELQRFVKSKPTSPSTGSAPINKDGYTHDEQRALQTARNKSAAQHAAAQYAQRNTRGASELKEYKPSPGPQFVKHSNPSDQPADKTPANLQKKKGLPGRREYLNNTPITRSSSTPPSDARSSNPRMGKYSSKAGYAIPYADDTNRSPYKRGRRGRS